MLSTVTDDEIMLALKLALRASNQFINEAPSFPDTATASLQALLLAKQLHDPDFIVFARRIIISELAHLAESKARCQ